MKAKKVGIEKHCKRKSKGLVKNIRQHAAKDHFIEILQYKLNSEIIGERKASLICSHNKAYVVVRATSHRHCGLSKTQQYLLSKLPRVSCFSNNDIVIGPHIIDAG